MVWCYSLAWSYGLPHNAMWLTHTWLTRLVIMMMAHLGVSGKAPPDDVVATLQSKLHASYWYVRWPLVLLSMVLVGWPQSPTHKVKAWKNSSLPLLPDVIRFYETWVVMHVYEHPSS